MIRIHAVTVATAGLAAAAHAQSPTSRPLVPGAPDGVTAFVDVNVVPMDTERVLLRHTVLVEGGRITALGPASQVRAPAGAVRITGRGKYLMPSLSDCHAHFYYKGSDTATTELEKRELFLWLANGVTTLRVMDQFDAARQLRLRALAAEGRLLSPRLYITGLGRDEFGGKLNFIKRHVDGPKGANYDSLLAKARRAGIPVMSHVPDPARLEQALRWGQASIEHLTGYEQALIDGPPLPPEGVVSAKLLKADGRRLDLTKIPQLAAATARAGVWNCPTQWVFESSSRALNVDTMSWWPELEYVAPARRAEWIRQVSDQAKNVQKMMLGDGYLGLPGTLAARRQLIKALHDSGAGLLLGTDVTAGLLMRTGAVHRELDVLVRLVGLTPYQALATGTKNMGLFEAKFFQRLHETGTVAVGQRADVVLLSGNPLVDVRHTAQPAGVMIGGRWLARAEIDRRLAAIWSAESTRAGP